MAVRLRGVEVDPSVGRVRRRLIVIGLALVAITMFLVVTGVVDAAEHALAHVFPGLMLDGCGGG